MMKIFLFLIKGLLRDDLILIYTFHSNLIAYIKKDVKRVQLGIL